MNHRERRRRGFDAVASTIPERWIPPGANPTVGQTKCSPLFSRRASPYDQQGENQREKGHSLCPRVAASFPLSAEDATIFKLNRYHARIAGKRLDRLPHFASVFSRGSRPCRLLIPSKWPLARKCSARCAIGLLDSNSIQSGFCQFPIRFKAHPKGRRDFRETARISRRRRRRRQNISRKHDPIFGDECNCPRTRRVICNCIIRPRLQMV